MIATLKGNHVQTERGVKKDGTAFVHTTVLSGSDAVQLWGYDPGDAIKKFDPVQIEVEIKRGEKGLFVTPLKNGGK